MIAAVVRTGWMNLRRDRAALMLSYVVPIVFFSIFATVFGGRNSGMPKVPLAIADEDQSKRSRELVDALKNEGSMKAFESAKANSPRFTAASAEAYVKSGEAPVALVVPKGWDGQKPPLHLIADTSDPIAPEVVNGLLQKTIMTSMPSLLMNRGIDAMDRFGGGLTPTQRALLQSNMDSLEATPKAKRKASTFQSLVPIETTDILGKTKKSPMIAFYAAGIGVMFLLFTASNAGGALLEESESGTLDRILTTRVSLTKLLLGKLAYLWTLGFTQLLVMFLWGAFAFKLELFSHLSGFLIMATASALATAAFGLVLAGVARTRAQLGAISTLTVLTISAIGGSMFPRFLMPESFQKAGLVLFNSWAIDGFTNVFWRELPLTSLITPVAVLLGFALAFFIAARQLTRRWEIS